MEKEKKMMGKSKASLEKEKKMKSLSLMMDSVSGWKAEMMGKSKASLEKGKANEGAREGTAPLPSTKNVVSLFTSFAEGAREGGVPLLITDKVDS
ncbi:hypothetical protein HF521_005864 [Silurus meridionalis]|uniref:Uncharacterized protein n=1 Tax=Silurus meridionalis TaxID=175797 RepID=A0A8T0B146_SILME|nr:hypothetical protein HF521_005864 [Silurus meridionalis]